MLKEYTTNASYTDNVIEDVENFRWNLNIKQEQTFSFFLRGFAAVCTCSR